MSGSLLMTARERLVAGCDTLMWTGRWALDPQINASANVTNATITSTYGQLCWSEPSLVAHVTAQVIKFLRLEPNANIISVRVRTPT